VDWIGALSGAAINAFDLVGIGIEEMIDGDLIRLQGSEVEERDRPLLRKDISATEFALTNDAEVFVLSDLIGDGPRIELLVRGGDCRILPPDIDGGLKDSVGTTE